MTQAFKDILDRIKPDILENPDADLVTDGIIDSLDVMNLVAELEQTFEIDFDPDDVVPETFANAEAIWAVVQKYEAEKNEN